MNTSTRFWNSSGITLTGNLSGVQVKSESLQTLITGGISFDTLDPKAPTVTKVRRFTLFDSEEAAMARGVEIQLSIDNADGLREGTPIRFKGLDIGKIETNSSSSLSLQATKMSMYFGSMYFAMISLSSSSRRASRRLFGRLGSICS